MKIDWVENNPSVSITIYVKLWIPNESKSKLYSIKLVGEISILSRNIFSISILLFTSVVLNEKL